ncbi:Hybrid signal transduction histidine kinase J [Leucoagaricus sp. SymC.cos]|nr:Hybrid signal transduction histidine kinase J [Leucoagaricus sp. SymC.cos]
MEIDKLDHETTFSNRITPIFLLVHPTPRSTKTVPNSKLDKNSPSASASPVTNGGSSGSTTRPSLSLGTLPPTLDSNHYANLQPNHIAHAQALASNGSSSGSTSAPPTSHAFCPTCGKTISDPMVLPLYAGYGVIHPYANLTAGVVNGYGLGPFGLGPLGGTAGMGNGEGGDADSSGINSSGSSPMIVPSMGPLAHAAFESGMSAVEELKLLKAQVQDVARVCNAVARGDLSQKITVPVQGVVMVQLKDVINTMVDKLGQFAKEVTRVSQEVGTEGKLGGQALVLDVEGTWEKLTGVVNKLAANLTSQVRSIAKVTKAVALGDLSKQIEVDARGEILDLKNTVNGMVVRLRALAAEVTRVTLEVGSQGKLGGQAHVPDVEGVWFELVRNVNRMCSSLTDQVRSIAVVTTVVAGGDLTQKIEIQVEGEMSTLITFVNTVNEYDQRLCSVVDTMIRKGSMMNALNWTGIALSKMVGSLVRCTRMWSR